MESHQASIGRACRVVSLPRSMYYYKTTRDDTAVIDKLRELSESYPTEGQDLYYSRIRQQRPLSPFVDLAKGYIEGTKRSNELIPLLGPHKFYLVKNQLGNYVGLVEDRNEFDLHWYIILKYRGKKHLSSAMRTVILPHLFQDNRECQRITINKGMIGRINHVNSSELAKSLGFVYMEESNGIEVYTLDPKLYQDVY